VIDTAPDLFSGQFVIPCANELRQARQDQNNQEHLEAIFIAVLPDRKYISANGIPSNRRATRNSPVSI